MPYHIAVQIMACSVDKPNRKYWANLKRLARYLKGMPRFVQMFQIKNELEEEEFEGKVSIENWAMTRK